MAIITRRSLSKVLMPGIVKMFGDEYGEKKIEVVECASEEEAKLKAEVFKGMLQADETVRAEGNRLIFEPEYERYWRELIKSVEETKEAAVIKAIEKVFKNDPLQK